MQKLEEQFLLDNKELMLVQTKYDSKNQLLFAIMLKFFQIAGYHPSDEDVIDPLMISSLSTQLTITLPEEPVFDWNNRTIERFRSEIRGFLGFKKANRDHVEKLITYLIEHAAAKCLTNEQYKEIAYKFFKDQKLEPFSQNKIERYIATSIVRFEHKFFSNIYSLLSKETISTIDSLLKTDEIELENLAEDLSQESFALKESNTIKQLPLWLLKKDIAGAKLKLVADELEKTRFLQNILLPSSILAVFDRKLLLKYYHRVMALLPSHIKEYNINAKYGMMAIFIYIRSQVITDNLADVLLQLIHKMRTSAEAVITKLAVREVKINGKLDILYSMSKASLDHPNGIIKKRIYSSVSKNVLEKVVEDHKNIKNKWYQNLVQVKINSLYSHGSRSNILKLLTHFDWASSSEKAKDLVDAIEFIKSNMTSGDEYYPIEDKNEIPLNAINSTWKDVVISKNANKQDQVLRLNYEIAILEELGKYLSCKQLYIKGAYRFRSPEEDMPKDFDERANYYYELLKLAKTGKELTSLLKKDLTSSLTDLNANILANPFVSITGDKKKSRIKITPHEAQEAPLHLSKMQLEVNKRFAAINLIDILKEADFRINFSNQFHTIASREGIDREDFLKRLYYCLYGMGSNTGLKRIGGANFDTNYGDLLYFKRRYISASNIRAAITDVVNAIVEIRDPKIWGIVTTGCACDSKKIACWDQNLISQWHTRYRGRGVMIYWHVDQNSACIYSQLKTCSSSEVGSMINGFLKHDTQMNMNKAYTDTHGQSVIGFAISYLLHFELLPRIKGINKQKLYYASIGDDKLYPNLDPVLKGSINWKMIEQNYHEVVRYLAALKTGTVETETMIKHLSADNNNHPVYKALTEIGHAIKTIFLCKYITSQDLRIEINESLNVVERVNGLMGFIFYGKLGEISSNNASEQELSIVALHLLQVCMVYINTLLIQEVLRDQALFNTLTKEDRRAITPLIHSHINPYGLFPLDLKQRLHISNDNVNSPKLELEKVA